MRLSTYRRPSTRSAEAMSGEHMALRTLWMRMDCPLNRASAGALCETTATPSADDLVGDRARHRLRLHVALFGPRNRRHQLAGGLVAQQNRDAVDVHDLEGHVHDVRSSRSRSNSAGQLLRDVEQHRELHRLARLGRSRRRPAAGRRRRALAARDARRRAARHRTCLTIIPPARRRPRRGDRLGPAAWPSR